MAQIVSNGFLDLREMNFATLGALSHFGFFDNSNPSIDGSEMPGLVGTYSATDMIGFWDGAASFGNAPVKVAVGGNNFVLNAQNNPVSGTVTGLTMSETVQTGPGQTAFNYFAFVGVNISLVSMFEASLTESTADDQALIRQMLLGADRVTGSAFADYAWGWNGNDTLNGNGGNDTLAGNTGNDQVYGQAGNDVLRGDAGADTLHGGAGSDKLYGGGDTQRDVFVFGARSESPNTLARDVIYEFRSGIDDISLAAIDANIQQAGNQAFGWGGKTAGAYKVWYATAGSNATVFADVTGDKVADFSVQVNGVTTLAAGDFLL